MRIIKAEMRKVKPITFTYKYIGDESPELKKISEEARKRAFERIFKIAKQNIIERRRAQKGKDNENK